MESSSEQGKAIQFVYIDEESEQFGVTDEAMAFLAGIPRDKQVKVVAIAGPYRTGKSFFINRVLLNKKGGAELPGFEVGPTV